VDWCNWAADGSDEDGARVCGHPTDNGTLFIQPYPPTAPPANSAVLTEDLIHRTASAGYPHVSQLTTNDGHPVIVPAGAVVRAQSTRQPKYTY
jgi:hypothetical protein